MKLTLTAAVLTALVATAPVLASHIPGHDDSDPIWPVPLPGQDVFNGGAIFITAIGPYGGWEITETEFDITYVSDGATPAHDLAIYVSLLTTDGFREFHLTGADLGFGSGPGTFEGSLTTDALNGIAVESFFFPPYSVVDIEIGSVFGGIEGEAYFEDSFINFAVIPTPGALGLLGVAAGASGRRRRR